MDRDNIAYSIPEYENEVERWAMADVPVTLGDLGAGLLIDPSLCGEGFPKDECPNGNKCEDY